jgi:hypothetical protein
MRRERSMDKVTFKSNPYKAITFVIVMAVIGLAVGIVIDFALDGDDGAPVSAKTVMCHNGRSGGPVALPRVTVDAMTTDPSTQPSLLRHVAPMVLFNSAMIFSIAMDEKRDWKTAVAVVPFAITLAPFAGRLVDVQTAA